MAASSLSSDLWHQNRMFSLLYILSRRARNCFVSTKSTYRMERTIKPLDIIGSLYFYMLLKHCISSFLSLSEYHKDKFEWADSIMCCDCLITKIIIVLQSDHLIHIVHKLYWASMPLLNVWENIGRVENIILYITYKVIL